MEAKPNDLKLGVFVLVSFGVLCAGLFAFGAVSYFQRMIRAETYVSGNVDGLSVGAPVTLWGVKVGKVTKIDFSWNLYCRIRASLCHRRVRGQEEHRTSRIWAGHRSTNSQAGAKRLASAGQRARIHGHQPALP